MAKKAPSKATSKSAGKIKPKPKSADEIEPDLLPLEEPSEDKRSRRRRVPRKAVRLGLANAYRALASAASKGDAVAAAKFGEWAERYKDDEPQEQAPPPVLPTGVLALPASTQELLAGIDLEIDYIVRRYKQGYPCADVERLIAETAMACEMSDSTARTRWSNVATYIIADLDRIARDGDAPTPVDESDEDRRQRLLDGELARLRHQGKVRRGRPRKEVDQDSGGEQAERE